MSKIFISYARKDKDEVYPIVDELERNGFDCWIDKNGIESGSDYEKRILDAIDSCDVFLHMLSVNSKASTYVNEEYKYAAEINKRIVSIALKGAIDNPRVMFGFKTKDFIDIYDNEQKSKLIRDLKKWYGVESKPSANIKEKVTIATIGQKGAGKTCLSETIVHYLRSKGYPNCFGPKKLNPSGFNIFEYETEKNHYTHYDCRGEEYEFENHMEDDNHPYEYKTIKGTINSYLRSTREALNETDIAILVVSALDGPMPGIEEHIDLAKRCGVKEMVVFISQCSSIENDPDKLELLQLVEKDTLKLLEKHGYLNIPVLSGDSNYFTNEEWLKGLEGLIRTLDSIKIQKGTTNSTKENTTNSTLYGIMDAIFHFKG